MSQPLALELGPEVGVGRAGDVCEGGEGSGREAEREKLGGEQRGTLMG